MDAHRPVFATNGRIQMLNLLILAYIILLPIQLRTELGFRLAPSDGLLAIGIILSIARLRFIKSAWSFWHLAMLFMFSIATFVAAMTDGYLGEYALVQKDMGILLLFATYAVVTNGATSWSQIRRFLRAFVLSTVFYNLLAIMAFLGLWLAVFTIPWLNYGRFRLSGMLIDPNAYGGLLVVAYAVHMTTQYDNNGLRPGFLETFCAWTLGLGILLTFSRSAWMGLVAVFSVSAVLRRKLTARIAIVSVFAVAASLLVLGEGSGSFVYSMATRLPQVELRLDILAKAYDMFTRSPILGIGLGRFYEMHGLIIHNTLLWFLTEFGLLGFAIFLGFVFSIFYRGWKAYRLAPDSEKTLVLALILAHAAMLGLSLGIEALYQRHWWLVMALVSSAYAFVVKGSAGLRVSAVER